MISARSAAAPIGLGGASSEGRVAGFESDIARYDQRLADVRLELRELGPAVLARQSWEREHRPALDRIDELDREIRVVEAFDRVASREA